MVAVEFQLVCSLLMRISIKGRGTAPVSCSFPYPLYWKAPAIGSFYSHQTGAFTPQLLISGSGLVTHPCVCFRNDLDISKYNQTVLQRISITSSFFLES